MKKKVLGFAVIFTMVLMVFSTVASNDDLKKKVLDPDTTLEDGATITCDRDPGNKAKCWKRNPGGLGCYWTGKQSDWC